jgi:chlorophyll synthase
MQRANPINAGGGLALAPALLELLKPITWFPPMWAFLCGAVSSGQPFLDHLGLLVAGIVLAGPLLCGASQIVNDWFDREVDAINQPERAIPSGRVPGQLALYYAVAWSGLALAWGFGLGTWVGIASALGLILAWAYSAPPVRLKRNGWWGNAAVGLSYEGMAWITGAAVMLGGNLPPNEVLIIALLYSVGAHGIMTLNDFKSIEGDLAVGLRSLPAMLGADRSARLAGAVMVLPQIVVIGLLVSWQAHWQAAAIAALVLGQLLAMRRLLTDPRAFAPWYNGTGVTAYVSGMMITATALPGVAG